MTAAFISALLYSRQDRDRQQHDIFMTSFGRNRETTFEDEVNTPVGHAL